MSDLKDCAGTCIVCIPDCPVQVRQREEAAENAEVVRALLADLVERGVRPDRTGAGIKQ